MATRRAVLAMAALLLAETAIATQPAGVGQWLAALPRQAQALSFEAAGVALPLGGHVQGIQARYDAAGRRWIVFLSHDSDSVAYLLVVEFAAATADDWPVAGRLVHVECLPSDGRRPALRHGGGIQLSGDVLAIGVEDNQEKLRSQVQFWNVADPLRPRQLAHLTIARQDEQPKTATAGAVALVRHGDRDIVAVGNWDCRAIDFYVSNGLPLGDAACRFSHRMRWEADSAALHAVADASAPLDAPRGRYQGLNLFADTAGAGGAAGLSLLGFETAADGRDVVDLFRVDLTQPAERVLTKVERQAFGLTRGNHFRYAGGGLWRDGRLLLLGSPRNVEATTVLSLIR